MNTPMMILVYAIIFIYGIIVGSFLNVCIYRIPKHETIVSERSHCMSCGYQLKWYDLVPLFSWLFLRGKCRKCGEKISVQYPLIEALNGILWLVTFIVCGFSITTMLACLVVSALVVISVIDFRTYEIPFGLNVFIFAVAVVNLLVRVFIYGDNVLEYVIGMFLVSGIFAFIFKVSGGRAIGFGDVKLMFAAGLFVGWKLIFVAMLFGCFYGSVIHIIRMKVSGKDHVLAFGPYLAMGIVTAIWFGEGIVSWYTGLIL